MAMAEFVVLLDDEGNAVGTADKCTVHGPDTPLHLAFSCYVFNDDDQFLIARRAPEKQTWPGVWTNSFCGHPAPNESVVEAVHRRGRDELGLTLAGIRCVLPDFRYRAVAADGVVENEICPVFVARATTVPRLNPDEVVESRWIPWEDFLDVARTHPWLVSPWSARQARELGGDLPRTLRAPA